jgi:hypothetical protein
MFFSFATVISSSSLPPRTPCYCSVLAPAVSSFILSLWVVLPATALCPIDKSLPSRPPCSCPGFSPLDHRVAASSATLLLLLFCRRGSYVFLLSASALALHSIVWCRLLAFLFATVLFSRLTTRPLLYLCPGSARALALYSTSRAMPFLLYY